MCVCVCVCVVQVTLLWVAKLCLSVGTNVFPKSEGPQINTHGVTQNEHNLKTHQWENVRSKMQSYMTFGHLQHVKY